MLYLSVFENNPHFEPCLAKSQVRRFFFQESLASEVQGDDTCSASQMYLNKIWRWAKGNDGHMRGNNWSLKDVLMDIWFFLKGRDCTSVYILKHYGYQMRMVQRCV